MCTGRWRGCGPNSRRLMMTERDERALREALRNLGPDEPVDPEAARREAKEWRRNGRVAAGIAVALVLVAGVIGLPRLLPGEQARSTSAQEAGPASAPSAESAPADRAQARWRTEYYRDISFEVPDSWGYAVPPQSDWCADEPRGVPRPDQRRPYVWSLRAQQSRGRALQKRSSRRSH